MVASSLISNLVGTVQYLYAHSVQYESIAVSVNLADQWSALFLPSVFVNEAPRPHQIQVV